MDVLRGLHLAFKPQIFEDPTRDAARGGETHDPLTEGPGARLLVENRIRLQVAFIVYRFSNPIGGHAETAADEQQHYDTRGWQER